MASHIDTVRPAYEAFAQGDPSGLIGLFADDVVWDGPNSEEIPGGGRAEGKAAAEATLQRIAEQWDGYQGQADEFFAEGRTVVVLGHGQGTAKASGEEVKFPFVHVWRLRDDGTAEQVQALTDTLLLGKALRVAG
jgi:ketosteroid isomerase-like protein